MSNAATLDTTEIAKAHEPSAAIQGTDKELAAGPLDVEKHPPTYYASDEEYDDKPTEEELHTLRRIAGPIKWGMFTIAFVELCERFSYYGSSVLYTNFVMRPLPEGRPTGSNPTAEGVPGALGKGQAAANAIVLFNQFFAYLMPLVG
jgi:proton-dependent oligopeptide transporter, POT family